MRAAGAGFRGTALFSRRTCARGCGELRAAVGRALAGPGPPALRLRRRSARSSLCPNRFRARVQQLLPAVVNRLSLRADKFAWTLARPKTSPMSKSRNLRAAVVGVHTRPEWSSESPSRNSNRKTRIPRIKSQKRRRPPQRADTLASSARWRLKSFEIAARRTSPSLGCSRRAAEAPET